jgi:hypothetical protein
MASCYANDGGEENAAPIHHGYSTAVPSVLKALFNTASTP